MFLDDALQFNFTFGNVKNSGQIVLGKSCVDCRLKKIDFKTSYK
jgi:hypothetical protein